MAIEPKRAYNRAPTFTSENYGYWKTCMRIHVNSVDKGVWDAIINGSNKVTMTNGVGEYYRVSHCEIAKAIWHTLEVSHEGTNEVKQVRVNTLNKEFELFRMKHGKTIFDMQKRFRHLINRLNALGKPISNDIATNKVLICINRE
ncbi:uncharacterized protein LOC127096171 [Lathyrus oleraceus]|uniref:uncharacterized protein LOC127096171 n=1 Tax=Pisum sativum TaxID=3888 RepID=UPI0021D35748|nr:uncharacterized protein LOC127096171 [Pisum sativum]